MLQIREEQVRVPILPNHVGLLDHLRRTVMRQVKEDLAPIRLAVTRTGDSYECEISLVAGLGEAERIKTSSMFEFAKRGPENTSSFNAVLLVPTGIGSTIGGHAGDATPVARLIGSVCDTVITHPNVVNASDVNDLPENGLYVEGSLISRLMMGTIGLQPVRSNRVLAIIDEHPDNLFTDAAINAVSAGRACYGLSCPAVVRLSPPIALKSEYAPSGRAVGRVEQLQGLVDVMQRYQGQYDAVALSTQIDVPNEYHVDYYKARGEMINPWGGVEAMLTHFLSSRYGIPTAHSPMLPSVDVGNIDLGQVDPRMAAEDISTTFFMCVLKGLQRAPRVIEGSGSWPGVLTASDVSCLVIPDGCVGLPTLAALEQGIPVIAVRENENIMQNDLASLPWQTGKFYAVENYWEAAGVLSALKGGIDPTSVRRPLPLTRNIRYDGSI